MWHSVSLLRGFVWLISTTVFLLNALGSPQLWQQVHVWMSTKRGMLLIKASLCKYRLKENPLKQSDSWSHHKRLWYPQHCGSPPPWGISVDSGRPGKRILACSSILKSNGTRYMTKSLRFLTEGEMLLPDGGSPKQISAVTSLIAPAVSNTWLAK